MSRPVLRVLSLRYSSWSMRPWLALRHAGVDFDTETVDLPRLSRQRIDGDDVTQADIDADDLPSRRGKGSVTGLFPVLWVGEAPIHESLAICEWVAETHPAANLWPSDSIHRAQARAVCAEMTSGFHALRGELSCHLFARVPDFQPSERARAEVARVLEIWSDLLERHGGPFLTGSFGITDCMYFPVLSRFRTYGVRLPAALESYAQRLEASAPVRALVDLARHAPRLQPYDDYITGLGGDPDAVLAR